MAHPVSQSDPTAVFGRRVVAVLLDLIIVFSLLALLWLASFLGSLLIFVVLQGLTGWTPGKLITGIRTVKADGSIVGIPKAFVRWILLIVDGQPCGLPLVGFITGLTTQGHQRVGDMAAKTFVVTRAAVGSPIAVPGLTAPPPPAATPVG